MNRNQQFTPGPWRVCDSDNLSGFSIAPENTLPTLACVERCSDGNVHIECYNFPGSTEANARLISAAPDLLQVATRAWQLLRPLINNPASNLFMEELREAIKKAVGDADLYALTEPLRDEYAKS